MVKLGTAKHVPIPEFYEETVEIEERAVPGAGSILFFFSKKDSFFCVYCLIITRVGEKRKLCRLDTTAFNNDLSTKVIGIPDEDKQETLMRLVGSSSQPPVDTIRPINDFDAGLSSLFKPQFNI